MIEHLEIVEIVEKAESVAIGAIVTGYANSAVRPHSGSVHSCPPTPLGRFYAGYGQMRAETGRPPRKGFGTLIGDASITDKERNRGLHLWLRVQD